jgi:hypothetical protein
VRVAPNTTPLSEPRSGDAPGPPDHRTTGPPDHQTTGSFVSAATRFQEFTEELFKDVDRVGR